MMKLLARNTVFYLVGCSSLVGALQLSTPAKAIDFPQFPTSIELIESDILPIEWIKKECTEINVEDNISSCISNTMIHWKSYRRGLERYPEAAKKCYETLKELNDYILINNCIDASAQK